MIGTLISMCDSAIGRALRRAQSKADARAIIDAVDASAASAAGIASARWVLLDTQTGPGGNDLLLSTGFSSAFDNYVIYLNALGNTVGGTLSMQVSDDGGSSLKTTSYNWAYTRLSNVAAMVERKGAGASSIQLADGSPAVGFVNGVIELSAAESPSGNFYMTARTRIYHKVPAGDYYLNEGFGVWNGSPGTSRINAVNLNLTSSGFNTDGVVRMFGIKNS